MYQFTTQNIAGLQVSQSVAKAGSVHRKRYSVGGVSPSNQDTLNVYVNGSFRFEVGSFSQDLVAGQTSLDLTIPSYPEGQICTETVLSDWACRFCISAKLPWVREAQVLAAGQSMSPSKDSVLVLLSGEVEVGESAMRPVSFRFLPRGAVVNATAPSAVIACRLV